MLMSAWRCSKCNCTKKNNAPPTTFAYFEYRQFRLAAACTECMNDIQATHTYHDNISLTFMGPKIRSYFKTRSLTSYHSWRKSQVNIDRAISMLTGADPGMGWSGPAPFWQLNCANSVYFGAISANFDSRPPLFVNPGSDPGLSTKARDLFVWLEWSTALSIGLC